MITINMYEGKWQIQIGNEIWAFDSLKDFEINLSKILSIKDKYGKLERNTKNWRT